MRDILARWLGVLALSCLISCLAGSAWAQPASTLPGPASGQPRALGLHMTASAPAPMPMAQTMAAAQPVLVGDPIQAANYRLGSGDKLKVIVYGEDDLGGEYLVGSNGEVQLPLLGQVPAAGLTLQDFQQSIAGKFVGEGYLKNPRISVEVENYRPFYIIGEVKQPGQYPYINGMNVLNAVALAGGYSYRADDRVVFVRRNGSASEIKINADQTAVIYPGDIIRVDERIF